jgi:hypothetical protein
LKEGFPGVAIYLCDAVNDFNGITHAPNPLPYGQYPVAPSWDYFFGLKFWRNCFFYKRRNNFNRMVCWDLPI